MLVDLSFHGGSCEIYHTKNLAAACCIHLVSDGEANTSLVSQRSVICVGWLVILV